MAGSHRPGGTGRAAPLTVALRLFMAPVQCVAATHWQAACRAGGSMPVPAERHAESLALSRHTGCQGPRFRACAGSVPPAALPVPLATAAASGTVAAAPAGQWPQARFRGEPRRDSERPPPTRVSSWHFHRPGPGHHMRPTAHGCHGLHLKFAAAWAAAGPGADPPPPESRVRD